LEGKWDEINPVTDAFLGDTLQETRDLILSHPPVPPGHLCSDIPGDLEAICLKCLAKRANQCYSSAELLADELGRFLLARVLPRGMPLPGASAGERR
jgi:hypothetical protein